MSWRWKIAGGLLFSLLLWELIIRLFVLSPAREVFEPRLGYVHAPYANVLRTYEGYARFQLDQFGLNNEPLPTVLPTNRVFVVGDSFVEAYQVMRSENFVSRLAKTWSDSLLFNAGSSGAAPDKSLISYDMLAPLVKPTHVLLCVNASDLYEILSAQEWRDTDGDLTALLRTMDKPSRFTPLKLWLYGHSALITHLKWKYENDIRAWLIGFNEKKVARKSHELVGIDLQKALEHWHFVLRSLQKTGVKLSILIMPELEYLPNKQVHLRVRQGRMVLASEAIKFGIPVLDSNAVFAQDFEKNGQPAIGFANTHYGKGHINAHGHQVLANWLDEQRSVILR